MSNSKTSSSLGFFSILALVFITLKLLGVINWSWWWVFSPILPGVAVGAICLIVALVAYSWAGILWLRMTPEEREFTKTRDRLVKNLRSYGK